MNWAALAGLASRANVEDRRDENPVVEPTAKDSLVRNLPQSEYEWGLYQQLLERRNARRSGSPLPPDPLLPISIEGHRNERKVHSLVDAVTSVSPELQKRVALNRRFGAEEKKHAPTETERARQHGLMLLALRDMRAREGRAP